MNDADVSELKSWQKASKQLSGDDFPSSEICIVWQDCGPGALETNNEQFFGKI